MRMGPWDLPDNPEMMLNLAKRINSAGAIQARKIRFIEEHHAQIMGSGYDPYDVSFESCSCFDFQTHKSYPCKHMIRLAIAEGIMDGIPVFSAEKNREIDFDHDIEKYTKYWKDGAISSATYSKIVSALMEGRKKSNSSNPKY